MSDARSSQVNDDSSAVVAILAVEVGMGGYEDASKIGHNQ